MIEVKNYTAVDTIDITFDDIATINQILAMYPNRKIRFMSGPIGVSVNNTQIKASVKALNYSPKNLPVVTNDGFDQIQHHIKAVLDEVFESLADIESVFPMELYLYSITLNTHRCLIRGCFIFKSELQQ